MLCPNCKTENPDASLLCSRCGTALNASATKPSLTKTAFNEPIIAGAPAGASIEEGAPYKASGRSGSSGLPLLLVASIVTAVLVGLLYFFVSQFIDLILVFPLIAGALVGFGLTFAVRAGKVRNPKLAGTFGVLAALLMMGTMDMARAWSVRPDMIDGFTEGEMADAATAAPGSPESLTPKQLAAREKNVRADITQFLTPWQTLYIYERLAAEEGTSIGRAGSGSSGSGLPIKGKIYWLLRIGELLAVALVSAAIAAGAASEPFCERCDKWQEDEEVLKVHPSQNGQLWEKIGARDWDGLMATPPGDGMDEKNVTTVKITHCPDCQSGTIGATSAGGQVPDEFSKRVIAPESTRVLLEKSRNAKRPSTA